MISQWPVGLAANVIANIAELDHAASTKVMREAAEEAAAAGGDWYDQEIAKVWIRTIVKPLWRLPPSEAKKPSKISRTKIVALQLPKTSLSKGYQDQLSTPNPQVC